MGEVKRQGGISLIPSLWQRIDEAARLAGVPRNRIMENVLMDRFGLPDDSRKSRVNTRDMDEPLPELRP